MAPAAGWLATDLPRAPALFGIGLVTMVLVAAGGRLITLVGFGVPSMGERPPPAAPTPAESD